MQVRSSQRPSLSNSGHVTHPAGTLELGISPPYPPSSSFPHCSSLSHRLPPIPSGLVRPPSRDRKREPDSKDASRLPSNRPLPRHQGLFGPSPSSLRKRRWRRQSQGGSTRERGGVRPRDAAGGRGGSAASASYAEEAGEVRWVERWLPGGCSKGCRGLGPGQYLLWMASRMGGSENRDAFARVESSFQNLFPPLPPPISSVGENFLTLA